MAEASSLALKSPEYRERDLGADALNRLQEPKPFTFDLGDKTEQSDLIFTHMCLDRKRGGLPDARQFLQRARRAMDLVADAVDVDDD